MECIIDLNNIILENRDRMVFFATHDYIAYKDHLYIVLDRCDGSNITRYRLPGDYIKYECFIINKELFFLFVQHFYLLVIGRFKHLLLKHWSFLLQNLGRK